MVKRYTVDALVISRKHVGEADRLVRLFTREWGLINAIAKGVRKIPSRRGGHLEPYTLVRVLLSETRAGIFIQAVETLNYFKGLRSDKNALGHARTISLVVAQLFGEQEPQEELFDSLEFAWEALPRLPVVKRCVLESTIVLAALNRAGLMPNLNSCIRCGAKRVTEPVLFTSQGNGWVCLLCHSSFEGTEYSLSPRMLAVVRFIAQHPEKAARVVVPEGESMQLIAAIRKLVATILQQPAFVQSSYET